VVAAIGAAIWDGPTASTDRYMVRDGDTLEWTPRDCALSRIGLACLPQPLRLYGVDAFEAAQTCRDAEGKQWTCGAVATRRLEELVARPGFACNVDNEFTDKRAREFAVCTVDGKDVGALLVSEGLAFYYGRGLQYLAVEAKARREKRGAWAGSFVRPQFWRQGARS
jgi:endonuclease YncB( thermonuclease family)